jgi:hypothetical protein
LSTTPDSAITGTKNKGLLKVLTSAVLAGLLIVFGLTWWNAYANYHAGEKYLKEKSYSQAVLSFEQAILNYFPGSPYRERAVSSLFILGDLAYRENNISIALQAFQAILFAETSLSVYHERTKNYSLEAIEKLKKVNPNWVTSTIPHKFPSRFYSLITGLSLLFWVLSIFMFINNGIDKNGHFITPSAQFHLGSFGLGFFLWMAAILNL